MATQQFGSSVKKKRNAKGRRQQRARGRERCNCHGRPSCQIVVDLFLFNLLTPRITLHLSFHLSALFHPPSPPPLFSARMKHPWPHGSRVSREKSMPEEPGRRISRGGEGPARQQGQRLTENDERRTGEDKLRFARKADYMCRRFVFAGRFRSICDRTRYRRSEVRRRFFFARDRARRLYPRVLSTRDC